MGWLGFGCSACIIQELKWRGSKGVWIHRTRGDTTSRNGWAEEGGEEASGFPGVLQKTGVLSFCGTVGTSSGARAEILSPGAEGGGIFGNQPVLVACYGLVMVSMHNVVEDT